MESEPHLCEEEKERYLRQLLIFGPEGQAALKKSHVFIAGCGGLGSPIAMYLATAGVSTLTIVDNDTVALSNLNRQLLHGSVDIGREKVRSGEEILHAINPDITIRPISDSITPDTIPSLVADVDLIIDTADSKDTCLVLNQYAVNSGIPLIHGVVYGLHGQMMVIVPGTSTFLRCLVQSPV